jgi:hypothetical protein
MSIPAAALPVAPAPLEVLVELPDDPEPLAPDAGFAEVLVEVMNEVEVPFTESV